MTTEEFNRHAAARRAAFARLFFGDTGVSTKARQMPDR